MSFCKTCEINLVPNGMSFSEKKIKSLLSEYIPQFGEKEIDLFYSICNYSKAKNKSIILEQGRKDNILIFILKGSARAYQIDSEGNEITNHLRSEGRVFGDPLVFEDRVQLLNIAAIGELHYVKFDVSEFEQLALQNAKLMQFYLDFLKEVIITFSHRINTFVTMSATERYEDLIQWNPTYLKSTFDKHIATFLGVSPLTIHRVKKEKTKK